jgi:hypothetical protein
MCRQAGHQIWKLIWQMHRTMTVLMYSVQLLNLRQISIMEYLVSWAFDIQPMLYEIYDPYLCQGQGPLTYAGRKRSTAEHHHRGKQVLDIHLLKAEGWPLFRCSYLPA